MTPGAGEQQAHGGGECQASCMAAKLQELEQQVLAGGRPVAATRGHPNIWLPAMMLEDCAS
jgi:hypothetical protein